MKTKEVRIALLDMNNRHPNQGMRNIIDLAESFKSQVDFHVSITKFDVRYTSEVPNINDFDIFISSGGPGSPFKEGLIWEDLFADFLDNLWKHNQENKSKKYVFLVCHSFQLAVIHWNIAKVNKRRSYSFGVMPIHKTEDGKTDFLLKNLPDPFYAIDSRAYQCIAPNDEKIERLGMRILALEKIRPHVKLERAVMAIRFSNEIFGTQFHPEADPFGFMENLKDEKNKKRMIKQFGEEKYQETIDRIDDEDKIVLTQAQIIPRFLIDSANKILDN